MGIRETLNKNPGITAGVAGGIAVIAIAFVVYQFVGGGGSGAPTKAFYTTDDGKTWFKDDINKIPPFTVDGKEAVKAYIFKCGSTEFAAYLEKYTPQAQTVIQKMRNEPEKVGATAVNPELGMVQNVGTLVKKPGDPKWVNQSMGMYYQRVMDIKCPNGGTDMEPVDP